MTIRLLMTHIRHLVSAQQLPRSVNVWQGGELCCTQPHRPHNSGLGEDKYDVDVTASGVGIGADLVSRLQQFLGDLAVYAR